MRKLVRLAFCGVVAACALVSIALLLGIVGAISVRGFGAINWSFFTEQIRQVGADGGIFYNLLGTLILIGTALVACTPPAFALAVLFGYYFPSGRLRQTGLLGLYVLNGLPSILLGILGLIVFVKFLGWGKSWLSGGVLLGLMILPTVTISLLDRIDAVPRRYIEAAAGLGLDHSRIVWSVILPQSIGGWLTGSLLGLARAAGETAPIMFTATIFAGATVPKGIVDSPVLSLPYHIFILAQDSFDPGVTEKLWGTALVLVGLVALFGLIALPLRLRMHEEARS